VSGPERTSPVVPGGLRHRPGLRAANRVFGPTLVRSQRRRAGHVVLLYHRVGPDLDPAYPQLPAAELSRHLDVVCSLYEVVSLSELVRRSELDRSSRGLCAVTFDDGYRDFLEHAYPVLMRRQVPVTNFLVSDCVETGVATWNYRLNRLRPSLGAAPSMGWKEWLGSLPRQDREDWLLEQEQSRPQTSQPAMIRSSDLDSVDKRLVSWGSHSVSHATLGRVPAVTATDEVARSRATLRDLGAGPVTSFAYPNGSHGPIARQAVAAAGYTSAFAVGQRAVRAPYDPFCIPRFDVGARPADELLLELTGALQHARNLRRAARR
jgi:peptidoglycan/xylan/chitin deacetylase (PgdA/CDA1 family)